MPVEGTSNTTSRRPKERSKRYEGGESGYKRSLGAYGADDMGREERSMHAETDGRTYEHSHKPNERSAAATRYNTTRRSGGRHAEQN